jgi:hypothetical protein
MWTETQRAQTVVSTRTFYRRVQFDPRKLQRILAFPPDCGLTMALVELNRDDAKRGRLPDVCVYCGAPATCCRRRVFTGRTPITVIAGRGIPQARLPTCDRHRSHSLKRRLVQVVFACLLLGLAIVLSLLDARGGTPAWLAGLKQYRGALIVSTLTVFVILIVVRFVAFYSDVRLARVGWTTFVLTGVSEAFARACRREGREPIHTDLQASEILDVLPAKPTARRSLARPALRARTSPGAGRSLFLISVLVGGILAFIVCAAGVLVYLKMGSVSAPPVTLSNARITLALGIAIHIKVDYRCQKLLAPERQYVLVVEQEGRSVAQRSFPGTELHDRGTLDIDVLANLVRRAGRLSVFLEESSPAGADRQRISDVLSLRPSR